MRNKAGGENCSNGSSSAEKAISFLPAWWEQKAKENKERSFSNILVVVIHPFLQIYCHKDGMILAARLQHWEEGCYWSLFSPLALIAIGFAFLLVGRHIADRRREKDRGKDSIMVLTLHCLHWPFWKLDCWSSQGHGHFRAAQLRESIAMLMADGD